MPNGGTANAYTAQLDPIEVTKWLNPGKAPHRRTRTASACHLSFRMKFVSESNGLHIAVIQPTRNPPVVPLAKRPKLVVSWTTPGGDSGSTAEAAPPQNPPVL
jgi:hypothetical protein